MFVNCIFSISLFNVFARQVPLVARCYHIVI